MTTPLVEEPVDAAQQQPDSLEAFTIPTISLEKSRQETISALRDASLSSGFFQLADIQSWIPRTLVIQMFEQMALFFALPRSEKEKVSLSATIASF